jgi:thiamine-monophosphate kinase
MSASVGEFDLIARWFTRPVKRAALGVGDDCAVLTPRAGFQIAISTDLLVEGRHFLSTVPPQHLGHKSLAVNLSDLAACGAAPLAFTLSLALPRVEESFLDGFSKGLWALAEQHQLDLIGGDTTAGPLTIGITIFGEVPTDGALLRSGAKPGDELWVSGGLGDARLALEWFRDRVSLDEAGLRQARQAMELPEPRVELGQALRGVASSAIDLSDGLLGDLQHVLRRSGVGAVLEEGLIPRSALMARQTPELQRLCVLTGGDDYELLFTAAPLQRSSVLEAAKAARTPVTLIGRIVSEPGLSVVGASGHPVPIEDLRSFDHFVT